MLHAELPSPAVLSHWFAAPPRHAVQSCSRVYALRALDGASLWSTELMEQFLFACVHAEASSFPIA